MNSIYFVGRCKALETKLLSNLQLNELIKCREVAEVVTLLSQTKEYLPKLLGKTGKQSGKMANSLRRMKSDL